MNDRQTNIIIMTVVVTQKWLPKKTSAQLITHEGGHFDDGSASNTQSHKKTDILITTVMVVHN